MWRKSLLMFLAVALSHTITYAGGISTDAGITPAQSRWIMRTQFRYMGMENSMMRMNTSMVPLVFAYGVTPGFSLMARGMYVHQENELTGETYAGMNDLYLLSKFRLYRKNTSTYAFGIAPHLASNIPVGKEGISRGTWDPEVGLNVSFRPRYLSFDLSTSYTFDDILEKVSTEHANRYSMNIAISGNIPFKNNSSRAISPVLETNYMQSGRQSSATGAVKTLFISPGIAYIHSSLVLEALLQLPAWQSVSPGGPEQRNRLIIGVKYMF